MASTHTGESSSHCRKCDRDLDASAFHRCAKYPSGRYPWCKNCVVLHNERKRAMHPPPAEKTCAKCKRQLERVLFLPSMFSSDGLQSYCKECTRCAQTNGRAERRALLNWCMAQVRVHAPRPGNVELS